MAQRRMFSLKVIDTDRFLEMPVSSRLLYYDLSMRADDDGFVDSPKKILKMIGCSEDDYRLLIAKQYIIPFESGVCVIKHWNIHNLIRNDRYTMTEHKSELKALVKDHGKYEILTHNINVIPNDNQMATQVRLGKDSIGKDTKEKANTTAKSLKKPKLLPTSNLVKLRDITKKNIESYITFNNYELVYWNKMQLKQLELLCNRVLNIYMSEHDPVKESLEKIKTVFDKFIALKNSQSKFWSDMPFTPSVINSMYDRIMAVKDETIR